MVLDAAGLDRLSSAEGALLREQLRQALLAGGQVRAAAVTVAEVARGTARTRAVEAALARRHGGARVELVATDQPLALAVGRLLHDAGLGSEHLADAHVVAACAAADVAVVLTSDADDIRRLAVGQPGTRVLTRRPDRSLTR